MARRITEEKLTIAILDWLEINNWKIICFDFPQSGTGVLLHPNIQKKGNKNKGGFIPDIVAYKKHVAIFLENKDRFERKDYEKTNFLRNTMGYSTSIANLLANFKIHQIYYGIGIPASEKNKQKDKENWSLTDFTIMVNPKIDIEIVYDPNFLF